MLKPFLHEYGTSQSVRDGLLPVHPLVLHLPATLRASTLTMMRYTELAMRPSTEVITLTAPAALLASRPLRAIQRPHIRNRARPAAVARRPERTHQGREPRRVLLSG